MCLHQRKINFSLEANCKRSCCNCWQSLNHIIEIIIVKDILGGQNQSKHSFSDGGISAEIQIRGSILPTSTPACRDIKKKLFSRWEIVFPHISSNQWRRKRKSFYQLFFFLAPSMEVPRLAAISYKRHLMNRLKHGEGIPSSAPTLQGIYRSIHYSDIVGSEEVSNRIKGHAVTTNQSWTTRINILSKNLGRYTRGHKYLSWGVWYAPQCSGPWLLAVD